MDLLSGLRKGDSSRGGRAEFKWEDVKEDKDRENYLGHSLMARVLPPPPILSHHLSISLIATNLPTNAIYLFASPPSPAFLSCFLYLTS